MSTAGLLRSAYLIYLSQPAADRSLYRALKGRTIRSLVEFGIGSGERTGRLLEVAAWEPATQPLQYTGIDLFEQRPKDRPGLTLKAAFAKLKFANVKVRLVPGDPYSALARIANQTSGVDVAVISADQDRESLERAWFYLPRMLHTDSLIFVEEPDPKGVTQYRTLKLHDIERLATAAGRAMRRAA